MGWGEGSKRVVCFTCHIAWLSVRLERTPHLACALECDLNVMKRDTLQTCLVVRLQRTRYMAAYSSSTGRCDVAWAN